MKWVNHKILTGSIMYAASSNLIFTGIAIIGSVFPDWIEGSPNKKDSRIWRKRHRKKSHCLGFYLILQMFIYLLYFYSVYINEDMIIKNIFIFLYYFVSGAILHILQDAICGQVPLWGKKWIGIRLFEVGSVKEYIYTTIASIVFFSFSYYKNVNF